MMLTNNVLSSLIYLVCALASAIGGLLVGLIGTGSSLVMMPTLTLVLPVLLPGYDILRLAAGTTMATMAAGAISASYSRFRSGDIDFRLLRLVLIPYICGALTGPWISRYLPTGLLRWYLAVILVIIAIRLLLIRDNRPRPVRNYHDHPF